MDYLDLLKHLDNKVEIKEIEEIECEHDIILSDYTYVCRKCGVIQSEEYEKEDYNSTQHCIQQTSLFFKPRTYISSGNSDKHKVLTRLHQWANYNTREVEADKCYGLIKDMLIILIPNYEGENHIGDKILNHAKLIWYNLYILAEDEKKIRTRSAIRKGVFAYCIFKAFNQFDYNYDIIESLSQLNIPISKYNKALLKVNDEDKIYLHTRLLKYLEIIQTYRPDISQYYLIERFNENYKNKIKKNKQENRINVNKNSLLKTLSYKIISKFITKQEAYLQFDITAITLSKSLRHII